jgi:Transposase DDE domain group 1
VSRKKVSATFDGGRITSDGGVALLALAAKVEHIADPIRVQRTETASAAVRGFAETRHGAKSWKCERRVVARIEVTPMGLDIRWVVTSLETSSPEEVYAALYCARGQAENPIKLHKTQLKSDEPPIAHPWPIRCGRSCTPPQTG